MHRDYRRVGYAGARAGEVVHPAPRGGIALVDYNAAAGPNVVHALQGGSDALGRLYIEATWCGIDKTKPAWAHVRLTDAAPTCGSCKRNLRAASRGWRR